MNTSLDSQAGDDLTVKEEVEEELLWTPEVDPARIGVSVHDGVVTLSGEVRTFAERIAATEAAMGVRGVLSVADDLTVDLAAEAAQSDAHVARAVLDALARDTAIPGGAITAEVRDGTVTLKGEVEWNHERESARRAVEHLPGVRFLDSRIELSRRPSASDTEERIRRAIERDTMVAIASVGAERTLSVRPRGGGEVQRFPLGHGDLIVMGGSCQRTHEHAILKTKQAVGPRISVQFRPRWSRSAGGND